MAQVAAGRAMSRRSLLAALGFGTAATVVVGGCAVPPPTPQPPPGAPETGSFPDGVMAGDPHSDGAVIWTRVLPARADRSVGLMWTVAEDAAFSRIVAGGLVEARPGDGHCVSVRVAGLRPDRWYHYRFELPEVPGAVSRSGRLRTAPAPGSSPDRLRFAFASCQQINDSWFVAHRAMAAEPGLDFMMHLGDYVYVSDTGTVSVDDYRGAYRRWREQPFLRDLHAAVPCVAMWDDGEFYNGVDRTGPPARLANAKQAWFESFPVLDPGGRRAHRSFGWGDLADVPMIDVRAYRDPAIDATDYTADNGQWDPTRSTLGREQYQWFTGLLAASTARWRFVGNPYNINPWKLVDLEVLRALRPDLPPNAGIYAPNEAWDDYMAERRDLLRFLVDRGVGDTVFCSGHTHIWLTSLLRPDHDDQSSPVAAYDFCTGSLTADPDPRRAQLGDLPLDVADGVLRAAERWVLSQNAPDLRYMNLVDQGYTVVDATPEAVEVTVRLVDTFDGGATAFDGARFRVRHGVPGIETLPVAGGKGSLA
jgi:alkaline phosphatase D